MTDLHLWTVARIAKALRDEQISPVELLGDVLKQYEKANPLINAFVRVDSESAMRAAKESEERFRAGKPISALDGVPISIKDNLFARGLPATWGSGQFRDHVAGTDELPVASIRALGAVILGKTNVPAYALQGYTCNSIFGATRNPWCLPLTPGGSSGGAAAAVASGIGPVALATDGGGSTRRPAGYTNLVGLKPSVGRIPRAGGFARILYDLEVIGLIARTVEDMRIFYEVAARGSGESDSWTYGDRPGSLALRIPRRIRVHLSFGAPVESQIASATGQAAMRMADLGAQVEASPPLFSPEEMESLLEVVFSTGLARIFERDEATKDLHPSLHALLERGRRVSGHQYLDTINRMWELRSHAERIFGEADLLLTPTSAAMPWCCDQPFPTSIAGRPAGPRAHAIFTGFANVLGLPAISLPVHPFPDGVPIGIQLVARYGDEERLLAAATAYEQAFPWAHEWPAVIEPTLSSAPCLLDKMDSS